MTNLLKFLLAAAVSLGISNAVYADDLIDDHIPIGNPETLEGTSVAQGLVHYLADVTNTKFEEFHISLKAKDEELKNEFQGHIYAKPYEKGSGNPASLNNSPWSQKANTLEKVLIFHDEMDSTNPKYSPLYSIAVHDMAAHKFEIGFKSFACQKSDCNGRGKCNSGKCECNEDKYKWAGSEHCSHDILKNLEFGSADPMEVQLPPNSQKSFHYKGSQEENFAEVMLSVERTTANGVLHVIGLMTKPEDGSPSSDKNHFYEYIRPGSTKTQIPIPSSLAKQDFVITIKTEGLNSDVTMSTKINTCPNDCTGNGTCNKDTQRCECKEGYFADDCSFKARPLTNKVLQVEILPKSSENFVVELNSSHASSYVQLALTIDSMSTKTDVPNALPRAFINEGKAPNEHEYRYTSAMPLQKFQRIPTPTSGLGVPKLFITTVNPSVVDKSEFKISLSTDITCPNGCSGNGVCKDTGVCECKKGFLGADCSVEVERGTLHWAVVVVIGFIALLVGAFINHFFIRKPATPEDSSNNYAELQA